MKSLRDRFFSKVSKQKNGCWLWTAGFFKSGYGSIRLDAGEGCDGAHRVSWRLHKGPIPKGLWVLHKCDNRACVNPKHLFLGTPTDNTTDRNTKGKNKCGESHPNSKLTDAKVKRIRLLRNKKTPHEIAAMYGVRPQTIYPILLGKSWRHVT